MLRIGTAGVPITCESRDTIEGIKCVRALGLDAMELEFVRQVYVKTESDAKRIGETARKEDVALSVHAPYFINLNSPDKATLETSRKRILDSVRMAHFAGARSVVIHSAYYMKMGREEAYTHVKEQYKLLSKEIKDRGYTGVILRPELMGKFSQFADIDELIRLCTEVEGLQPCVDFAHYTAMHPRENSYEGFCGLLEKVEKGLGKAALKDMHIHFSGIEYTPKGERNHLVFDEAELKWKDMVRAWKDFRIEGIAISESPNIEVDAQKAKKYYDSL
ncbi:MAG: TIM barrel protein [Candidatus Micrarchaeia archaeon]